MTEILLRRELEPLARQRQRFKLLVALAVAWVVVAFVAFGAFAVSRYFLPLPMSSVVKKLTRKPTTAAPSTAAPMTARPACVSFPA